MIKHLTSGKLGHLVKDSLESHPDQDHQKPELKIKKGVKEQNDIVVQFSIKFYEYKIDDWWIQKLCYIPSYKIILLTFLQFRNDR